MATNSPAPLLPPLPAALNLPELVQFAKDNPTEWLWGKRIPLGSVAMLAGTGGVGKSLLMSALEIAIVAGLGQFLEQDVVCGPVLHFDTDTEAKTQAPHYERAAAGLGVSVSGLGTELLQYRALEQAITLEMFEQIGNEIAAVQPVLVVVDAFASSFPYVKSNSAEEIASLMRYLKGWARLGPAVVIIDHVAKSTKQGPALIERGPAGSHYKVGGTRSVQLLDNVPARDVDGRTVLKLEQMKNNLGPMLDPLGIERRVVGAGIQHHVCELPSSETGGASISRAVQAIRSLLHAVTLQRGELLPRVIDEANCGERTARRALEQLVAAREVREILLAGHDRGPKAYKLRGSLDDSQNAL